MAAKHNTLVPKESQSCVIVTTSVWYRQLAYGLRHIAKHTEVPGVSLIINAPVSTKDLIWMMSSIIIKRKVQVLVNAGLRAAF